MKQSPIEWQTVIPDASTQDVNLGKIEEGEFCYCGRRLRQDAEFHVSIDIDA